MKKSLLLIVSVMMMISLALVGCSSGETGGDSGEEGGETQDTLVFGRGADSSSMDPATETDGETFYVTQQIYDTLLRYKPGTTELTEGLATDWKTSEDGLTYTLTLREGVKFHDGTDFNAEAVVANFERWMSSEDYVYYGSMFGGYGDDKSNIIKSVNAVDESTVEFKLRRPSSPFLKNLAMSPFAIASPDAFDQLAKNPVGTGPFVFEEWKPDTSITLAKNEDYWEEGKPKLERVIFQVIPDNSSRLTALQNGEIDLMVGVNPTDASKIESDETLQAFYRPPMNVGYMAMNVEMEPFDDPAVRRAINHSVDKQALIEGFYAGKAEAAKNPIAPTIEGYNDQIEPYAYDPEKAKQILSEAGYKEGELEVTLWTMDNPRPYMPAPAKIAESIQKDLSEIGITANIQQLDWSTYLERAGNGELSLFLLGWIGDNGDADNFLYTLLGTGSGNNYAQYSNKKVDELLLQAQSEVDQAKRNELYKKAQEIIHKDAPWVPLVHYESVIAGKKSLKGYKPNPTGSESFVNVYFE